ncbi:unnamed protein product [Coregonus sp. 'balchen']|nr:unnamed protein product [Coregonus sp. 'balchen']
MDTETDRASLSDWESIPQPQPHDEDAQAHWETWDWESEMVPAVLSPTYKQRNEDFRKLFKQLPDSEHYSCALQRDILLQGRLYVSENWICFYSNIFRWETLHFFTSFGARDRTYMMMFRLWQNALLEKPLCPKELWHFVHQCYGNELGLTSDDEDYVPPDDDFNTMGYCEELPVEENDANDTTTLAKTPDAKGDTSPLLSRRVFPNNALPCPGTIDPLLPFDLAAVDDFPLCLPDGELLALQLPVLDNRSSAGEVQAFHEDLNGKQYINEVYEFSVDKMYDILFTESTFMRDFLEQRRFSDIVYHPWKKEKESGNQTREIMYTVSLTNPLAPKTATVTETQTLYKASQESECYIIDAEVIAHDVPYHDYFYTLNRYMLTRVAKNKCRLSKVEVVLAEPHRQSPKARALRAGALRRRKRPLVHLRPPHMDEALSPVTTPEDEEEVTRHHRIKHVAGSTQTRHIPDHVPGGLALYSVSKLLLMISFVKLPQTQLEWAQLLESQQRYHDDELQKWKEIIKSSVMLLDEMKDSLLNLQKGMGLKNYNSESEEKRSRYH